MQDNPDFVELDRLIQRSIDESLSESNAQKLNSLLQGSAEARQRYNEIHETHTALCEVFPSKKLRDCVSPQTQAASATSRVVAHSSTRQPRKTPPKLQLASANRGALTTVDDMINEQRATRFMGSCDP